MRLVIRFGYGDGYTYSATRTVPVDYESAEAFLVGFMDAAAAAMKAQARDFEFADAWFCPSPFFERLDAESSRTLQPHELLKAHGSTFLIVTPEVLTVDEWFAQAHTRTPS